MITLLWTFIGALAGYVDSPPGARVAGMGVAILGALGGGSLFVRYAQVASADLLATCAALTAARIIGTACHLGAARWLRRRDASVFGPQPAPLRYVVLRVANDG